MPTEAQEDGADAHRRRIPDEELDEVFTDRRVSDIAGYDGDEGSRMRNRILPKGSRLRTSTSPYARRRKRTPREMNGAMQEWYSAK